MLKEILAVSGKPGLYKLVSKGSNLLIIESLTDKKRIPAYARDKVISLGDITLFTEGGDVSISEVLTSIHAKEDGKNISIDLAKADTDELRAYLAEVLPNFDRERVYPSDIKKLLKWYDILIANGITDFSKKEEEDKENATEDTVETETPPAEEEKETPKAATPITTPQTTKPASSKRKDTSMISSAVKSAKAPKAKPMPKNATPKKSVVGSKRGS